MCRPNYKIRDNIQIKSLKHIRTEILSKQVLHKCLHFTVHKIIVQSIQILKNNP